MKRNILISAIFSLLIVGTAWYVSAASIFDIEFPISELGNCGDKTECKSYCNDLSHKNECLAFAKKYGLVDEKTAARAEKLPETGPGGCKGESECRNYCDSADNADECFAVNGRLHPPHRHGHQTVVRARLHV